MALRNNNIAVGIDADAANAIKALKDLKGAFTGVKVGAAAGAIAIAAMGAALGSATKKAMEHGAKLELVQSKTAVVFGDQLPMIQKWSQETAGAFGLTAINLEGMAAGFADLLVPMEFTRAEAAEMTTKVVGLAGAFSEWSAGTRTVEDTTRILARAMLGEREMLKDLGVDIRELDIKQRLMAKGQEHLTGNMLKQARAVATMEMIFERSKDAQEGFRVGGDNLTRTMREIEAAIKEVVQDVVLGMMPQLKSIAEVIKDEFIPALQDAGPFLVKLGINLIKVVEGALAMATAFAKVVSFITPVTDGLTSQERVWLHYAEVLGITDEKTGEFVKTEEEIAAALGLTTDELQAAMAPMGGYSAELLKAASVAKENREEIIAQINPYQDFASALGTNAEAMQKVKERTKEVIEAEIRAREETSNLQKAFKGLTNEQVASKLAQDLLNASLDDMPFEQQHAMLQSAAESLRAFHQTGIKGGSTLDSLRSLIFHMAGVSEADDVQKKQLQDKGRTHGAPPKTTFNVSEVTEALIPGSAAGFGETLRQALTGSGVISGFGGEQQRKGVAALFEGILGHGTIIGQQDMRNMAHTLVTEFAGRQATQREQEAGLGITINTGVGDPNAIAEEILRVLQLSPLAKSLDPNFIFQGAT
jgi:hypothetical protein